MSRAPEIVCRVIVDPEPLEGSANMAIDAALLQAAAEEPSGPVVRIYQWSEPTLSLGYFQKDDSPSTIESLRGCPRVHRLTGGGAILHHHELTYSCVIPRTHPIGREPVRLYDTLHCTILELLKSCGAKADFRANLPLPCGGPDITRASQQQPFLCFLRSDPRDLAAVGDDFAGYPKITGSAQRRRRGTILQHGSVVLKSSSLLPEMPGVLDLFPKFDLATFLHTMPGRLATSVSGEQIVSNYTVQERQFAFEFLEPIKNDSTVR